MCVLLYDITDTRSNKLFLIDNLDCISPGGTYFNACMAVWWPEAWKMSQYLYHWPQNYRWVPSVGREMAPQLTF